MARKIGILDVHQSASDTPITYVSKNAAAALVRRLVVDWVIEGFLLRQRGEHRPTDIRQEPKPAPVTYIPVVLPHAEIPGLRFRQSEQMTIRAASAQVSKLRFLPRQEIRNNLFA